MWLCVVKYCQRFLLGRCNWRGVKNRVWKNDNIQGNIKALVWWSENQELRFLQPRLTLLLFLPLYLSSTSARVRQLTSQRTGWLNSSTQYKNNNNNKKHSSSNAIGKQDHKNIYKKKKTKKTGKTQAEKYGDSGFTKVRNGGCNLSKYPAAFKLHLLNKWDTNTLLDKDIFHWTMRERAEFHS